MKYNVLTIDLKDLPMEEKHGVMYALMSLITQHGLSTTINYNSVSKAVSVKTPGSTANELRGYVEAFTKNFIDSINKEKPNGGNEIRSDEANDESDSCDCLKGDCACANARCE